MLEMKHVCIEYGAGHRVVDDFNLTMKAGEIVSIVGESGSGKTTVIRAIMGALAEKGQVSAGDIRFHGEDMKDYNLQTWRGLRGTKISMIFQDCGGALNPVRRIGKQFAEYIMTHEKCSKHEAYDKAKGMLANMRLADADHVMKSYPFQLSGGMRQRVGIAMAMTFNPELLLADEPTSALDVTTQAQIVRQMMELRERYQTSIIMVTHNLGVAAYMADKLIVMKDGKVVDAGTREEVLGNPSNVYTKKLLRSVPELGGDYLA